VACPLACLSATSRASKLRWSVIKCCTCRAHHTAYNRHTRLCSGAVWQHQRASSRPLLSRMLLKANGSSSAVVLPRCFNNFCHPSEHGLYAFILFNVVVKGNFATKFFLKKLSSFILLLLARFYRCVFCIAKSREKLNGPLVNVTR